VARLQDHGWAKHATHFRFLLGSLGTLTLCHFGTGPQHWERLARTDLINLEMKNR